MIKLENHLGIVEISENYFSQLIGNAASSCFGVVGMANTGAKQGIRSLIFSRRDFMDRGVSVRQDGDGVSVDLHIIVTYGLNISAIEKSIVNKVRYTVEDATGLQVKKVNIYVDGMKS